MFLQVLIDFIEGRSDFTISDASKAAAGYLFFIPSTLFAYGIEKLAARPKFKREIVWILIVLNLILLLTFPVWYIVHFDVDYTNRMFYLMEATVFMMKFLSYHHIWHDVRYHLIKANKFKEALDSEKKTSPR